MRLFHVHTCQWPLVSILFVFLTSSTLSQNLVPNGGFETGNCIEYPGNLVECDDWYISLPEFEGVNPDPEWFHTCIENDAFAPPDVAFGFQEPYEGNGYASLLAYSTSVPISSYREVIGVQLIEPLEIGQTYEVRFQFSPLSNNPDNYLSINNLGFNFSTIQFYEEEGFPINVSHFAIDTVVPFTDDWLEISELYTADSAYQYLHISNFFGDDFTIATPTSENSSTARFAIDDVSVEHTTLNNISQEKKHKGVVIFPNPASDFIQIGLDDKTKAVSEVQILSPEGELVLTFYQVDHQNEVQIDVSTLSHGLYFVRVKTSDGILFDRFVKTKN